MLWEEDPKEQEYEVPDDVVDISFKLNCKMIPTTHAWPLQQALYKALPWLKDEPQAAIHQIHGASSGNGWERPPDGELIHLSKRSRMSLRLPSHRVDDARKLIGQTLDIDGYPVEITGSETVKLLQPLPTLFARYVVAPDGMDENRFVDWVVEQLKKENINIRKMLCGISHIVSTPDADLETRSVMIADLGKPDSIKLQQKGLGPGRHLGCGIFMPQKGIRAVGEAEDKSHFTGA